MKLRKVVSTYAEAVAEFDGRKGVTSALVVDELFGFLKDRPQEECWVLLLNSRNKPIGMVQASVGTVNQSLVHPREIFGPAIRMNAVSIVFVHNHPSGDPEPSTDDISVTERLRKVGELIGIPVLDSVVIASEGFVSLKETGRMLQ